MKGFRNVNNVSSVIRQVKNTYPRSSNSGGVVALDGNAEVIRNLKVGIIKDLHSNGLITQSQMEQAILKANKNKGLTTQTSCGTISAPDKTEECESA